MLYPIIRRQRRPLVPVEALQTAIAPAAQATVPPARKPAESKPESLPENDHEKAAEQSEQQTE